MGKFSNDHLIKMPKRVDDYKKEIIKRNLMDVKTSSNMANYLKNILTTISQNQISSKEDLKNIVNDLFTVMCQMQNHFTDSTDYYIKGAIMLEAENFTEVCKVKTLSYISIAGEKIESKDVYITPERYLNTISDDVVEITPEQLMLFRTAERAFNFATENVEFITVEKYKEIADKINAI